MPATERQPQTVLGFDYGSRRIGTAVGQTVTASARALGCLHAAADSSPPWEAIMDLVEAWRPARLVVGRPRHLDGRDSPLAGAARAFAGELARRSGLPVELWDEALSSEAARAALADQRSRGARRADRDRLNAQAACEILGGWLAEGRHESSHA